MDCAHRFRLAMDVRWSYYRGFNRVCSKGDMMDLYHFGGTKHENGFWRKNRGADWFGHVGGVARCLVFVLYFFGPWLFFTPSLEGEHRNDTPKRGV